MLDNYGRNIDYMRISITDRCNLRCVYCMPEEGVKLVDHEKIMTYGEIVRLCKIFAKNGIKKIKLTGGEPLVRLDLPILVKAIKNIKGIEQVTLTTNGVLLEEKIEELHKAGIDGINISLDTLDREEFARITRRDQFDKVWRGIEKALEYKDIRVKLNTVPLNQSRQDITDIVSLSKDRDLHVRFIEVMPIGFGRDYDFISEDDIKNIISEEFGPLTPYDKKLGNGPSHYFSLEGFKGKIGFISAISHKFCNECNRVRLTSQGFLKTCLQYNIGINLLEQIRDGADDKQLENAFKQAIGLKPLEHNFLSGNISKEELKGMSQIGG